MMHANETLIISGGRHGIPLKVINGFEARMVDCETKCVASQNKDITYLHLTYLQSQQY